MDLRNSHSLSHPSLCVLEHLERAREPVFHQLKRLPSPHNLANRLQNEAIPTLLAGEAEVESKEKKLLLLWKRFCRLREIVSVIFNEGANIILKNLTFMSVPFGISIFVLCIRAHEY